MLYLCRVDLAPTPLYLSVCLSVIMHHSHNEDGIVTIGKKKATGHIVFLTPCVFSTMVDGTNPCDINWEDPDEDLWGDEVLRCPLLAACALLVCSPWLTSGVLLLCLCCA